ncbi:hypothetical protein J2X66_000369 [Pseudomonas sp. 3296]|uniref:hypothetical protein n=1 Tax=Pseudomonas sp. 3296 TaxID=2817753 RepID=UPI00285ED577|nr:hypothetical protein [Pseudomonas sp. 3296]MDR6913522.1 hypothetical protein [Pseudomonas sp. 3296]
MTSFNQATLDALKAEATNTYKIRTDGYDAYATTCPKTLRAIPGWVIGAEVAVVVVGPYEIIPTYIEYAAKGFTYHPTGTMATGAGQRIHFYKPESPKMVDGKEVRIEGVPYQCDDIIKIHDEVEAKYRAECAATDKAASEAEEARIYAEALAEIQQEEAAALADKAAVRAAQIEARIAEKSQTKPATKRTAK